MESYTKNPFDLLTEDNDMLKYRIDEDGNYVFESESYNDMYRLSIIMGAKGEIWKKMDGRIWYFRCKNDKQKKKAETLFYGQEK